MYRSDVPLGTCGLWSVHETFFPVGNATVSGLELSRDGVNWMCDKPEEIESMREGIEEAKRRGGQVLKLGLGLGAFVDLVLESPLVECITVVENSLEVIELVASHVESKHGARVRVVEADGLAWRPDRHFTVGYHDIWLKGPTEEEEKTLLAHYAPYCDWQGVWRCPW